MKVKSVFWITAIWFWSGLVVVSSNYMTIPMIPLFADVFSISANQAAWTGSAFSLFYAIGSLFSGPLSDRFGRKQVIVAGLFVLAVITFLLAFIEHFATFVALRSIQGLAAASFAPVAIAYVVDKYPGNKIVTAIGFISSGFLMSGIIGQVASSYISETYSWHIVFIVFGALYLITALIVLGLIPRIERQQIDGNVLLMFKQFFHVLTRRSILYCYFITLTILLIFVGMYTALGQLLSDQFGLTDQHIMTVRAIGIIGMLFAPFAGQLAARFGIQTVLRGSLAIAVAGLAVLGVSSSLSLLIVMSVLFVTGIALTVPSLISLVGQLGGKLHGAAVSLYAFILFIGTSIGPIVSMALLQTGSYSLTLESLALLLFISFVVSFFIRTQERAQQT